MSLLDALTSKGYAFRRHLEEEGWTKRALTVVDLTDDEKSALESGGLPALRAALEAAGLWSFPALDIETPLPRRAGVPLAVGAYPSACVVAPVDHPVLGPLARDFIAHVAERFDVHLVLHDDIGASIDLLRVQNVVLFGAAHESRFGLDFALRYQTGFLDATVPGPGGAAAVVHAGLDASGHNVLQVTCDAAARAGTFAVLTRAVTREADRLHLGHLHHIVPGAAMRAHLPSWDTFAASLTKRIPGLDEPPADPPTDPVPLSELIGSGLHSGGPEVNLYNAAPVDHAVSAARYYQLTGDTRALELFHALLFRLADYYLKTPEGASYIADLDFRSGSLVLYYARLEHETLFTDADRLVLSNLLLSAMRSCYEYALKIWPVEPGGPTRHNHETFPARSLLYGAEYFARYHLPQPDEWLSYANAVFSGGIWSRFKQRENAHTYEQTAYEHGSCYSAFTGNRLDLFEGDCLNKAALRLAIATDNFFRPVDYGDTSIHVDGGISDVLALLVSASGDARSAAADGPLLQWYAGEAFSRQHHFLSSPIHGIPGLRLGKPGAPPQSRTWERMPLDPRFLAEREPDFPERYAFDMLAFRTGWGEDDHYLFFEGVGNRKVSHSHNEVNGITRLNHLGRHWIVSNGYGRLAGLTNVNQSFNTRVLGPDDHNMLVLRREGEIVTDLPLCSALIQSGQSGDLAYATGALLGYSGVDWYRTLLLLADRFLLVIDRIHVARPGIESAHIEWNGLGRLSEGRDGFRLDQKGVFMDILSASPGSRAQGVADRSADWKRVLDSGAYPHASFPLAKMIYNVPDAGPGDRCLVTLLAATRTAEPAFAVTEPASGRAVVESLSTPFPDLEVTVDDLTIHASGSTFRAGFHPLPDLPPDLAAFTATA